MSKYHVCVAYNENKNQFVEFDIMGFKTTDDKLIYYTNDDIVYINKDRIYDIFITKLDI